MPSHPPKDVIKNTALAYMRQYEIAKVAPTVQDAVPNLPQIKPEDLKRISDGAELAVKTYLNTFYRDDDPDHVVFDGFYDALVQERSAL